MKPEEIENLADELCVKTLEHILKTKGKCKIEGRMCAMCLVEAACPKCTGGLMDPKELYKYVKANYNKMLKRFKLKEIKKL